MAVPNNLGNIPMIGRYLVLIVFACANLTVESVALDCVIGSSIAASEDILFTKIGFSTRW